MRIKRVLLLLLSIAVLLSFVPATGFANAARSAKIPVKIEFEAKCDELLAQVGSNYIGGDWYFYAGNKYTVTYDDSSVETYICCDVPNSSHVGYFLNGDTSKEGFFDDELVSGSTVIEGDNTFILYMTSYGNEVSATVHVRGVKDLYPGGPDDEEEDEDLSASPKTIAFEAKCGELLAQAGENYIGGNWYYYEGNKYTVTYNDGSVETYICREVKEADGIYVGYFLDGDTSKPEGMFGYSLVSGSTVIEGDNTFILYMTSYGNEVSATVHVRGVKDLDSLIHEMLNQKESQPVNSPAGSGIPNQSVPQTVTVQSVVAGSTVSVLSASAKTVAFTKAANKTSVVVPDTVVIAGETFKVTTVDANAFKGSKAKAVTLGKNIQIVKKNAFKGSSVKTITVKTKKLTKKSVKNSLKGSKIKTVKVRVGSSSQNKQFAKKYKKIFSKKNVGKAVSVK